MPAAHDDTRRDPVEELAADFLQRRRKGEHPSIEEYVAKYPALADEIRELFPTIAALERLKGSPSERAITASHVACPERLGDCRLLREIGRGGMGIVFEAEQESLGRRVAVKLLPQQLFFDTTRLQRFRREARMAAALSHPGIVPVYHVGEQDGLHYLVMQLIDGEGLDVLTAQVRHKTASSNRATSEQGSGGRPIEVGSRADQLCSALLSGHFSPTTSAICSSSGSITSNRDSAASRIEIDEAALARLDDAGGIATAAFCVDETDDGLPSRLILPDAPQDRSVSTVVNVGADYWRNVCRIGVQAAEALGYAHSLGTLHRDIKPANLLLDRRGVVWISDFGLAKSIDQSAGADGLSRSGELVGTIRYMAPEQFQGSCGERSDIYSLGLTLYELAALQPAYSADSPSQLIAKITQEPPPAPRRVAPNVPVELETIILKAIERDPADRYESASAMANDLNCFLESRPISAQRSAPWERMSRWGRRNPVTAVLSALVLLLSVTTVTGMVAYLNGRGQTTSPNSAEDQLPTAADALGSVAPTGDFDAPETALDSPVNEFGPPKTRLPGAVFGPPPERFGPGNGARRHLRFEYEPFGPPSSPRGWRGGLPEGPPRRRVQPPRDRRGPPL